MIDTNFETKLANLRLKHKKREEMSKLQIDRFHIKIKDNPELSNRFIKAVKDKYTSLAYFKRGEKRGYSRKSLYTFLLDYAKVYGNTCTEEEYTKYNNLFTLELYRIHQCYIHLIGDKHYKDILIHI